MERKNAESTNRKVREMGGGDAIIESHDLLDFDRNNLHRYHSQNLKEKNLVVRSYATEYIDPFDGNKVKDIRGTDGEAAHEAFEDFIPASRKEASPARHEEDLTPWELKFLGDETAHDPYETPVDQLMDEAAIVTAAVVSNIEAANLNNYDLRNLRARNHVVTRHETEYLDPFDGDRLKDIRESVG